MLVARVSLVEAALIAALVVGLVLTGVVALRSRTSGDA